MNADSRPVDLGGGLVLRTATEADVEGILAVEVDAFGASDGPGIEAALEEAGGPANWAVVIEGAGSGAERVVSASALLDHTLEVSGSDVRAGQVEWVATYAEHQRRGLVRAQFERHHRLAAERGHLVVLIAGIPYFYRRFGYGYGLDYPTLYIFDDEQARQAAAASEVSVRAATASDIGQLQALESLRPTDGVRIRRHEPFWRRLLASQRGERSRYEQLLVAVSADDELRGWVHTKHEGHDGDGRLYVEAGVTVGAAATDALIGHAVQEATAAGSLVVAYDTPGTPHGDRLAELGKVARFFAGYYTLTPDPVGLLRALQPALSARLTNSERYAARSGTLELSLYNDGVALDFADGVVGDVRAVAGREDPLEEFGVGVAPDWLGALALGRWGASGLAGRADDVMLGRHVGLMDTLFPRLPADISADL